MSTNTKQDKLKEEFEKTFENLVVTFWPQKYQNSKRRAGEKLWDWIQQHYISREEHKKTIKELISNWHVNSLEIMRRMSDFFEFLKQKHT